MNKTDLINAVASSAELSKAKAGKVVESLLDAITDALKEGKDVSLIGFGTFSVRERAGRSGRNPRTGQPLEIKAAKIPGFKAGKALRDAVK
jgi:DNA-binding protein HU-beta